MCSNGYVNCDKKHFRIVYLILLNCRFKNRLTTYKLLHQVSICRCNDLLVVKSTYQPLNRLKLSPYNDLVSYKSL